MKFEALQHTKIYHSDISNHFFIYLQPLPIHEFELTAHDYKSALTSHSPFSEVILIICMPLIFCNGIEAR